MFFTACFLCLEKLDQKNRSESQKDSYNRAEGKSLFINNGGDSGGNDGAAHTADGK